MKRKFSRILGVGLTIAMLVSTLAFAVPALAVISAPAVTVTPTTISANAQYVIKFDTIFALSDNSSSSPGARDTITVVFPSGTTLPTADLADGLNGSYISVSKDNAATYTTANVSFTAASRTYVIKIPDGLYTVGPVHMAVKFTTGAGIYNPGTTGSYILTVKTSQETTVVDSTAYTITSPLKVERYNKSGNFVGTYSTIADALTASVDYDTLKLGAGTFTETVSIAEGKDYVTIVAIGTAAETIIKGNVTITGTYATLDTLTITGTVTVAASGNNTTIQNSILKKSSSTSAATLLTNNGVDLTVKNSTIDTTSGTVKDWGVKMAAPGATAKLSGITFKVDADAGLISDIAIETSVALTTATNSLVVETSTITGDATGGIGYYDDKGSIGVVIKTSTFSALEQAININHASAKALIQGNTIQTSILSGTGTASKGAIDLGANNGVTVESNTITGNKGYSLKVTDSDNVTVSGNSFSGNTLGLRNTDSVNSLNAKLNWWGATTGPTHATANPSGTGEIISDYVTFKPYLTGSTSAARIATTTAGVASSLDASTTAGIAVEGVTTVAAAQIVATKLAANPKTIEPAYTALAGAWFDLYISAASSTTISAKFYATGITSLTQAYFYSGLQGKWVAASDQGVSGDGTFVWVNIKAVGATAPTVPTTSDLTGTPFVLVEAPAVVAAVTVASISLTTPAAGAIDRAVTNLPFTWASVSGATSYTLVISASDNLSSPVVTATTTGEAYQYTGTLSNSTNYFWQVTALKDTTTVGKSAIATFSTVAKAVVVTPPPAVVVPAAPISILSPALGAIDVSLNPILTWTPYTGAIGYEVALGTDPAFKIIDYGHSVPAANTFYASETLAYATTYYWRVRGVTGAAKKVGATAPGSAWAAGVFTTMVEPVAPVAPAKVEPQIIIQKEPAPPAEVIQVPVTTVVPQPIPSYLLWIIIVIGAVLIIALIVLIARTRRVA